MYEFMNSKSFMNIHNPNHACHILCTELLTESKLPLKRSCLGKKNHKCLNNSVILLLYLFIIKIYTYNFVLGTENFNDPN